MSIKVIATTSVEPQVRRACVIFPGALGDFICFLPALNALAHRFPLDLFSQCQFADITPEGVTVRPLEGPEMSKLFARESRDDEKLKNFFGAYDTVYSWFGSRNEQFVARLQALTDGRARFFPFRPAAPQGHQVDYYLGCINRGEYLPNQPSIALRHDAIQWRENFWANHALAQRRVLVIAPGSGAREKNWPEDFFLSVAQWWGATTGGATLLIIGPVERERGGIERLRSSCLVAENLCLSQAAALLCRCTVYLGNDSGMSHLAAALGIRSIALFGPSDPRQWAPRGDKVVVARRDVACSPCLETIMKSCPHRACLRKLHPGEVVGILAMLPEVLS